MKKTLNISAILAFGLCCVEAFAADAESEAQKRFEDGKDFFKQGKFAEAAASFREAHSLKPSWKLYFNIAQSDAAARNYGRALEAFERYLAEGGDEIPVEREEEVLKEISHLKTKVGAVHLSAPAGAAVFINDIHRGNAPLPGTLRVSAGREHRLLVKQGDNVILERMIRVGSGEKLRLELTAEGESSPEPRPGVSVEETASGEPRGEAPRPLRLAGWGLIGTGGAMMVGSAVTGGITLSKASDLKDECPDKNCADTEAKDRHDTAWKLGVVTNVLIVGGAVVAAAGLTLLLADFRKEKAERTTISLAPAVGPGVTGLMLKGWF